MDYAYKLTTHGRAVMAACMALEKPFHITGIAFGSGLVSEDTNLADVHELLEYVSDGAITERRHKDDRLELTVQFANVDHPDVPTFILTEFMVYVEDPTSGENTDLLYGTLGDYRQPVPAYHPAYPPSVFSFPLTLVLSDELQVMVSAPAGLVTCDDLRSMMESGELSAAPSGVGAPTEDTPGVVGGRYFDTAAKQEYICVEVTPDGKTVWQPSGGGCVFNTDITIPADGWAQTGTGRYPCSRDIPLDGVTARMIPSLTVLEEGEAIAIACGLAPRVQTVDGAVRVFAANIPAADIPATLTLQGDASGFILPGSGENGGTAPPVATANRLGMVKPGAGLNVAPDGTMSVDFASDAEVSKLLTEALAPDNK